MAVVAAATTMFFAAGAADAGSVHAGVGARTSVRHSTTVHVRHGAMVGARAQFEPHGFHHGRKVGFEGRTVPPGWSHGRKVGWHHHSTPPGLR